MSATGRSNFNPSKAKATRNGGGGVGEPTRRDCVQGLARRAAGWFSAASVVWPTSRVASSHSVADVEWVEVERMVSMSTPGWGSGTGRSVVLRSYNRYLGADCNLTAPPGAWLLLTGAGPALDEQNRIGGPRS